MATLRLKGRKLGKFEIKPVFAAPNPIGLALMLMAAWLLLSVVLGDVCQNERRGFCWLAG
jgi:hypothetical protein